MKTLPIGPLYNYNSTSVFSSSEDHKPTTKSPYTEFRGESCLLSEYNQLIQHKTDSPLHRTTLRIA